MEKPYIKKFSTLPGNFEVWIVDGGYIRYKIDEEFTNFGHHYRFRFIPKNEFWIDRESKPGEEQFYIDSMITMVSWIKKGATHEEAVEHADRKEKRERAKSEIVKEIKKTREHDKEIIKKVHIKLFKSYSKKNLKLWIVNGELVRDLFFIDFTEGGHGLVYPFVPKDEVWIDDDLNQRERKFVLLHELHERNLMSKGMNYENAHRKSSEIELYCRIHPTKLPKELKEELKKNNF